MIQTAQSGDTVKVHYSGRFESGEIFDSSAGAQPFEFELGCGQIIPGFENAILGMQTGAKKTVTIGPEERYDEHDENLVFIMPITDLPDDLTPHIGMQLQLVDQEEHMLPAVITEILDDSITLDANHPLAGVTLVFDIERIEIVSKLILTT